MNKKELTNTIKQLAFHYGERVTCEWLSPDGCDWIEWKNAEINTLFLVDLEKGYIRNIQISDHLTSSMRTPKPIIKQWCDPLMTFHKHCSCYSLLTLR